MAGQGGRSRRPSFTVADWTAAAWWVGSRNVSRRVVDPSVRQDRDSHCSFGIGLLYAILSSPAAKTRHRGHQSEQSAARQLGQASTAKLGLIWFG